MTIRRFDEYGTLARDLGDGRTLYLFPLIGNRSRLCIGRTDDLMGYDDGY